MDGWKGSAGHCVVRALGDRRLRAAADRDNRPASVGPCLLVHGPIAAHGARSASSCGRPADIVAMFAGGWKSSASAYGTPSRRAGRRPTADLPDPATPMTTTTGSRAPAAVMLLTPPRPKCAPNKRHRYELFKRVSLKVIRKRSGVAGAA